MFEVNGVKIGENCAPYVIAELSANHGGDIELNNLLRPQKKLVRALLNCKLTAQIQ